MTKGFFVAGTDTGVGKTRVSCGLLHAFAANGNNVVGMKPVVAGCENGQWLDVELLAAASNVDVPRKHINPYAFAPALAPHIAAAQAKIEIDLTVIRQAYIELSNNVDVVIVEGAGGFLVPLNDKQDGADLAKILGLPVILVVGMRLGCLNHALLTVQAIQAAGLHLAGWVANCIDPNIMVLEENIHTLKQRLGCPLLGILPFNEALKKQYLFKFLDISKLVVDNK